jgi:hypothetical protein
MGALSEGFLVSLAVARRQSVPLGEHSLFLLCVNVVS